MTTQRDRQDYAIHVDVEGTPLPPHPGVGWTRFVCISDTHSRKYHVPSGDVLLHGGDLSSWGHPPQLATTVEWLKTLDHPVKIIVAGNHDIRVYDCSKVPMLNGVARSCVSIESGVGRSIQMSVIERTRAYVRSQSCFGLHYLEHESLCFTAPTGRVWKVHGSPASPLYVHGSFQYEYEAVTEAQAIYNKIPKDTEVLITHTPPFRILDKTRKGINAGCQILSSRLDNLKDCRLHVFGHIHEAVGAHVHEVGSAQSCRVSVNAAMHRSGSVIVVDLRN